MFKRVCLLVVVVLAMVLTAPAGGVYSDLVYPGDSGRLVYRPTVIGDRVLDFSMVGYKGGGVSRPDVTQLVTPDRIIAVAPVAGDDHPTIQAAIDLVEAKSLNAYGFRGVVQLEAGEYQIADTKRLEIMASGVVLRGAGASETVIRAEGVNQRTLIVAGPTTGSWPGEYLNAEVGGTSHEVIDKYVPVGAMSMRLDGTSGLAAGDNVIVHRRCNDAWITEIGMDSIPDSGDTVQWTAGAYQFYMQRKIVRIDGQRVFLNAGLSTSIDERWGGGRVYKYSGIPGRINNVGVENLRGITDYASDADPDHSKSLINFRRVEDGWIRNVTGVHFSYAIATLSRYSKSITVENCSSLDPKGPRVGGWRYPFVTSGQLHLFMNCYSENSRHDYVTSSRTHGPIVFTDSVAYQTNTEVGPHHRWANGLLFDKIIVSGAGGELAAWNRGNYGTGHGWSGANIVFWNSEAPVFQVQNPPTAQNWVIGGIGAIATSYPKDFLNSELAIYDSHGGHVSLGDSAGNPGDSLYTAQFNERFADPNAVFLEYVAGDFDLYDYNGPGSEDDVFVDANWLADVNSYAVSNGLVLESFDQNDANHVVPFSFAFALGPGERVEAATLIVAIKKIGDSTGNDSIWIEDMNEAGRVSFADLELGDELAADSNEFVIFEFTGAGLCSLQDGQLNAAIGDDEAVDWARLGLVVTTSDKNGDINDDRRTDHYDMAVLTGEWLNVGGCLLADLNIDSTVDLIDYAIIGRGWDGPKKEVTIFEKFDDDPTTRGWIDAEAGDTTFDYNSAGYLDAVIYRDDANTARYYKGLGEVFDEEEAFWFEMDLVVVSNSGDYSMCQFGVFDSNSSDNHYNFVGDRFAYDNYHSAPLGNRSDIYGYASDGTELVGLGSPTSPGIAYGQKVRVKGHYWYQGGQGKAELGVYEINGDGSTGNIIMSTPTTVVIGAADALRFDIFGLGNRTDKSYLTNNVIKADNLYFSNARENPNPVLPSF